MRVFVGQLVKRGRGKRVVPSPTSSKGRISRRASARVQTIQSRAATRTKTTPPPLVIGDPSFDALLDGRAHAHSVPSRAYARLHCIPCTPSTCGVMPVQGCASRRVQSIALFTRNVNDTQMGTKTPEWFFSGFRMRRTIYRPTTNDNWFYIVQSDLLNTFKHTYFNKNAINTK